jgi:hypothetical protein
MVSVKSRQSVVGSIVKSGARYLELTEFTPLYLVFTEVNLRGTRWLWDGFHFIWLYTEGENLNEPPLEPTLPPKLVWRPLL